MAGNILLEVVTPEQNVVSEKAQMVVAPGVEGEFGVLIGHTTFLTTLKTGGIRYTDANGTERCVFVSGGFAEALPNKLTILAESAERRCDIDIQRAQSAMERAKTRIDAESETDIDFVRARAALERAIHRIRVAKTKG